ncbi:MAG: PAS domain-containing sensor histidine kinase [Cyanobacteria bacterium SZAS LIN-2]|nr:PAS domain-containing sensor histidine kinase [Cyanobacteria bacterium SZAS LIN-3]MBS1996254.1 PAS domain-containing sensor histidine kinase [Cyanobacteria bacterium SZAS LIN-2]MBS2010705.1 PAS domain-containing sensor histidine kinase [Cyanobacteria bacterium SZAS TMP-1]
MSVDVTASIDGNGNFLSVSPSSLSAWKLTPDELKGSSIFEILLAEDVLIAQQCFLAATFMQEAKNFECRVVCPDASVKMMYWTAQWSEKENSMHLIAKDRPPSAGPGGAAVDIVETPRLNKDKIRSLLEFLPIGLLMINSDGKIDFANTVFEHMMETRHHGLEDRLIQTIFPFTTIMGTLDQMTLNRYVDVRFEMRINSDKGRQIPVEFSMQELDVGGTLMYLGIASSIGERLELQSMKKQFIEGISNQVRAPIVGVIDHLKGMLDGGYGRLSEQYQRGLEADVSELTETVDAIDALLEADKMETGQFKIRPEPNNIMVLIKQVVLSSLTPIREKDLVVEINGTDAPIMADESRMFQVIKTILSNAIRFSPPGSKVRVEVMDKDNRVRVEIIDRGCGMSEDQKKSIFERFRKSDNESGGIGSGKSLLIAKHILEKHGGVLGVISHPGTGSNFWFELPKMKEQ